MYPERLDLKIIEQRLHQLPNLEKALGKGWISTEFKKPIEQWSLITGWISSPDTSYWYWLVDLDIALGNLQTAVSHNVFQTIKGKVKSHSDRANTKSILSEIAIMVFLANNKISFELEHMLVSDGKNTDIRAFLSQDNTLNIEVQWLSPSDASERGATIASAYGEAYPIDFDYEEFRIKQKVFDKIPKFTRNDITFVALDCTTSPELGGSFIGSPIGTAISGAFTGKSIHGDDLPFAESSIDTRIREFIDGVIWFQLSPGRKIYPLERGICLNPSSQSIKQVINFARLWETQDYG